jgi:hypothetical protein
MTTAYATVQELRDEGLSESQFGDEALQRKILFCSSLIDRWTGRWFYPRALTLVLDGSGCDILQLGSPIISVDGVRVLSQSTLSSDAELLDITQLRVYNRHLSGLLDPDDRNNPKIQWVAPVIGASTGRLLLPGGFFPNGVQNVEVTGTFGYTDPDDAVPEGKTPELIKQACMMLVVRESLKIADVDGRQEQALAGRVTSLRTRDQSITWNPAKQTSYTGDPRIDSIIASFRRPPTLGAV